MTQQVPITFWKRPRAFDRAAASQEYEQKHPEFSEVIKDALAHTDTIDTFVVHRENPKEFFQKRFGYIHVHRMQGLPIIHTELTVEALPFVLIQSDNNVLWLGVVVTPWSVQAIVVPTEHSHWEHYPAGTHIDIELPGGTFDFIACQDQFLGHYRMCSLKSPVFDLADQDTARAFGLACLSLMLGEHEIPEEPEPVSATLSGSEKTTNTKALSRREFFSRWKQA